MAPPAPTKSQLSAAGIFLLCAACTAVIGVPTGLYVANRANTAMIVQQQTLSQVQTFESTGGQLDNTVRRVSDALATGKSPEKGRDSLRDAVAEHSSAAFVLRDELGGDYPPYMAKMRELRNYADNAETPREGVAMWQAAADLIAMRKRASERITGEATQ